MFSITPPKRPGQKPQMVIEIEPHQTEFIESEARYVALGGGVRNGKSTAAILKLRRRLRSEENTHWWVGRWDATEFDKQTFNDWFTLFPQDKKYFNHTKKILSLPGNRVVDFIHLSDLDHLTNATLDGFWIEQAEECTLETFNFLRMRLSKPGAQGLITFNPKGEDWIYWLFATNEEMKHLPAGTKHNLTQREYSPRYHLIMASTDDNACNLDAEYIKDLDDLPEEISKRMREGEFDSRGGKVIKEFRHDVHIVDPFPIPEFWNGYVSSDWGKRNWWATLFSKVNAAGDVFIADELYKKETLVSELAGMIKAKKATIGGRWNMTIIDPGTWMKENPNWQKNGKPKILTLKDELDSCGVSARTAQELGLKDIDMGIERMQKYFHVDLDHVHPLRQVKPSPRIFIFRTCTNFIRQLIAYRRPERSGRSALNIEPSEDPIHKDCDGVDALRYLLMYRPPVSQLQRITPPDSVKAMINQIRQSELVESGRRR